MAAAAAAPGKPPAAAFTTQQRSPRHTDVFRLSSFRSATKDASVLPPSASADHSDSVPPSIAAPSASSSLRQPLPPAADPTSLSSFPTHTDFPLSFLRRRATTSPALRQSVLLLATPRLLERQRASLTKEEQMKELKLPVSRRVWPEAAKLFREDLAALRTAKAAQLLRHLVKHKRLQQSLYGVEPVGEQETQKEGEKAGKAGLKTFTEEEADAGDTEWTPEEVRLLWQGKKLRRKKRRSPTIDRFDQQFPWDRLQLQALDQVPEGLQKDSKRALWWRDDEAATEYEEARAGTATSALREERKRGATPVAVAEPHEEESADEGLPVFGLRSIHKKQQLLTRVRPVWLPVPGPLHCDTGLPQSLIEASAAVAPPTSDEVRRLMFYPEEVKRREIEDGVVFETAGELLRRRFCRKWEQYLQQQHKERNRTKMRRRRREQGQESSSSSKRSSAVGVRIETDSLVIAAEGGESQTEADDGLEEYSGRELHNCTEGVYSGRERPVSYFEGGKGRRKGLGVPVLHATEEGMQNAAVTHSTTLPSPRPPPWLWPHRGLSQPPRTYTRYTRAAIVGAAATRRAQEERMAHANGGVAGRGKADSASGYGSCSGRKSNLLTPGGLLDEEMVVVRGPKKGWTWTIEDRHRWKRSRLLRRAMKNNQLVLAADLEDRQYAEDFERFMGKPFIPPRADWGGYAYYAAAEDEEEKFQEQEGEHRSERGSRGTSRRKGRSGGGGAAAVREKAWRDAFEAHLHKQKQREEAEEKAAQVTKPRDNVERSEETRLIKLCEVLENSLPSVFEGVPFPPRRKHPKKKTVSMARLRQYGEMIENITNCPFLQVDMQQALSEGWRYTRRHAAEVKHVPVPVGIPPDKYSATKESLQKAAEKLSVPMPEEDAAALAVARPQRVERVEEPEKVLGGGRYAV